jgi:hypothetical protein
VQPEPTIAPCHKAPPCGVTGRWCLMVDALLRMSTTAEVPQPAPAADGGDGADTPKGTGNESTSAGDSGPGR